MRLTNEQRARVLEALPRAERMALRYRNRWPGDPAELASLAFDALASLVATHDPRKGSLATYACKKLRGLIYEHAGWTAPDPFVRYLLGQLPELGGFEDETLEGALGDTPEEARRRAVRCTEMEIARLAAGALMGAAPRPPDEQLAAREARRRANEALERALAELPAQLVRFVKLRYRDSRSVGEIAQILGCDVRTVCRLNERAKLALARRLTAQGIEAPPPSAPPSSTGERFNALSTGDAEV